jgi:hypothetical protein
MGNSGHGPQRWVVQGFLHKTRIRFLVFRLSWRSHVRFGRVITNNVRYSVVGAVVNCGTAACEGVLTNVGVVACRLSLPLEFSPG